VMPAGRSIDPCRYRLFVMAGLDPTGAEVSPPPASCVRHYPLNVSTARLDLIAEPLSVITGPRPGDLSRHVRRVMAGSGPGHDVEAECDNVDAAISALLDPATTWRAFAAESQAFGRLA